MNKFEQLIEYVINDDEAKARELFHDIVVEKSRAIYEEMMADEEELEENDDMMGGDEADSLINDIETEESGISMEDDEMGGEFGAEDDGFADEMGDDDMGDDDMGEGGLEDRVVDLEDKLDELMAEFESLMGDEAGEDHGDEEMDMDMDMEVGDGMDDEEVVDDEMETEGFMEAVNLKAVPKPTHGDNGQNAKSPVAANSGARGAMAKPVSAGTNEGGHHDTPAYKNTTKDLIGRVQNTPAQSTVKQSPATKPHLAQASGVNTKSVTN